MTPPKTAEQLANEYWMNSDRLSSDKPITDAWLAGYRARDAEVAGLRAALERSLNWLSSYPGGGALKCWEQARAALASVPAAPPQMTDEEIRALWNMTIAEAFARGDKGSLGPIVRFARALLASQTKEPTQGNSTDESQPPGR